MSDTLSLRLGSVCSRLILASHCPEGPLQLPGEMSVSADHTYPDGITDEYLISQALMGEPGGDGARHGIAPHAPHALQASPHASPASHAHASHAGVRLDVRVHALSTHAHSPHGMLTPQAAGLPQALQPFGQHGSGNLFVLAESAPSGACPNEVIFGRHVPSPNASLHHDVGMPSPISQYSPRSDALKPLVERDAQSKLKTLRRELDEMKVVFEKMSSDIERFRLDAQLRDLMKRFDEYFGQQNSRMQRFAVDSDALRREIEARVSTSRPAAEPTKTPQIFDMSRDDGLFSRIQPLREHVPDVADLRDVASDQGGPLFPRGVVEHVPPGSLLNLTQRCPEHGGCVAALAPVASVFGVSETDVNSMFATAVSARSRNEADVQFMSSLPQKSSLYEQYMRTLAKIKRGPVPERRSDEPSVSQAAPAPCFGYVCERIAPSVQYPA